MSVLRKYRKDSILYFEGDARREIYLIKSGKVILNYKDITGEVEQNEVLAKGEFFGIRSAVAGVPREESVTCIEPAEILVFNVNEFESLIRQNPAIGLKILKILSYNIRQIGKEEKKIITQNAFEDPGNELYKMGLYFFEQRDYEKAISVWERFKNFFPHHPQLNEANEMIDKTKEAQKTGYHPTKN